MLIKICGTTLNSDAILASRAGADYIGVIVEHAASPRSITNQTARAIRQSLENENSQAKVVAVTVNLPLAQLLMIQEILAPDVFQLHGDEGRDCVAELVSRGLKVWATSGEQTMGFDPRPRAFELLEAGAEAIIVDARAMRADGEIIYGGTGHTSNWTLARDLSDQGAKVVLSGGLKPGNVEMAIEATRPWMVDAVSGIESQPGLKDPDKVRAFISNARKSAAELA